MTKRLQISSVDRGEARVLFRSAFSLIEMSMVVLVASLFTAFLLNINTNIRNPDCYTPTKQQLTQIREAIERFAVKNDRFPVPARRNVGRSDPLYGREAAPAALDANGGVLFGALPFQAIGLSPSYGADCWGNKFTYAVTTALTLSPTFLDNTTSGMLNVKSDAGTTFLAGAGYAVISHGDDELGAVKANYSGASNQWCNYPGNGELRSPNCALVTDKVDAKFNNGRDAGLAFFDDLIIARGKPWRNNKSCAATNFKWASNQCSVNVPLTNEGDTRTALASTSGTTGQTDVTCTNGVFVGSNQTCNTGCPSIYYQWGSGGVQCGVTVPAMVEGASQTGLTSTTASPGSVDMTCTAGSLVPSNQWCHADCGAGTDMTFGTSNDCNAIVTSTLAYGAQTTITADGTRGLKGTGQVLVQCMGGYLWPMAADTCQPSCRAAYAYWGPGNVCEGGWVNGDPVLFYNQTRTINSFGSHTGSIDVKCVGRDTITAVNAGTCTP